MEVMDFLQSYNRAARALREAEKTPQYHLEPFCNKKIVVISVVDLRDLLKALEPKVDDTIKEYINNKNNE
jgi:hypothetical protein